MTRRRAIDITIEDLQRALRLAEAQPASGLMLLIGAVTRLTGVCISQEDALEALGRKSSESDLDG